MKRWSKEETDFLKNNYEQNGANYCASKLYRSSSSVKFKANNLNLSYDKFRSWTDSEIDFLKTNYSNLGPKKCAEILGKKEFATQDKGKSLGLSSKLNSWSSDEIKFLKDNYSKFTINKLSKMMNRSYGSIKKKAQRLNLTNKELAWNHEEIEFINNNYKLHGSNYCAEKINRTKASVVQKYKSLNITIKQRIIWRTLLRHSIDRMGTSKNNSTHELLGYNSNQLKDRIEMNFLSGMSWINYGKWHIDHIKPVSKFSKDTPAKIVNSLCNLQPMWATDNLSKGNNFSI